MTNKTWYKYSERKPTEADARHGRVLVCLGANRVIITSLDWDYAPITKPLYWRRLEDDDFPPTERKLHPAWQPIQADRVYKGVWLFSNESGINSYVHEISGESALGLVYTHWQPAKIPPIFEDE